MNDQERNEHFKGFAKLLWQDLLNANEYGYIDVNKYDDDGIDPTDYITVIAQRAYDLTYHVLYCDGIDAEYHEQKNGSMLYQQEVVKRLERVPDLTAWPEQREK